MNGTNLSIVVPCYNTEKYIPDCLDSILGQKGDLVHRKVKVICVDDASKDGTNKVLRKYSEKYKNIVLISNSKNHGVSVARNIGIVNSADARGVMFVDSDDMIGAITNERSVPHFFNQYHLQYLLEESFRSDVGISVGSMVKMSEDGKLYVPDQWAYMDRGSYDSSDLYYNCTFAARHISSCNKIHDAKILMKTGNMFTPGLSYYEDALFSIKYLLRMQYPSVSYVQDTRYVYRKREDSLIHDKSPRALVKFFYDKGFYYADVLSYINHLPKSIDRERIYKHFARMFGCMADEIEPRKTNKTKLALERLSDCLPKACGSCQELICNQKCRDKKSLNKSIQMFHCFLTR
jgi:glycosyltransferase involved in cell wall biosynthesis